MGNIEPPVSQTVKYRVTQQQQEQNQIRKPQQVGVWLLGRKASKDGQKRVDLEGQENPSGREGRQVHSADPGALMYLPLGGSKSVR